MLFFHILSTSSVSYCLSFLLLRPLAQKPPCIVRGSYATIKALLSICLIAIKQIDNKAFIVAYEPRTIHGGFWAKGLKSKKLKQYDTDEVESI